MESLPEDDPLTKSAFHHILVGFGAPAHWPVWLVYLLAGVLAAGTAWIWSVRASTPTHWLLVFLMVVSFFLSDRQLLESLPRRRISFAPWTTQIFALALLRVLAAALLGALIPGLGWWPAFYINITLQILGTVALYRGAIIEPARLAMTKLAITTDRLPATSPPVRFLHISDLHVERLGIREAHLLDLVGTAEVDFILITGDYVNLSNNTDPITHGQVRQLLGQLSARHEVYAILGSPPVDLPQVIPPLFEGLPVRLLRDETVELTIPNGNRLSLIGLDCHHDIAADAATLDRVVAAAPQTSPRILLYHSPELMPQAVERDIDLYLCGHTHGGQVRLPFIGPLMTSSRLGRRYVMGHYHEENSHLYVSRGVGFEGLGAPRVRFLCPPEITMVTMTGTGR